MAPGYRMKANKTFTAKSLFGEYSRDVIYTKKFLSRTHLCRYPIGQDEDPDNEFLSNFTYNASKIGDRTTIIGTKKSIYNSCGTSDVEHNVMIGLLPQKNGEAVGYGQQDVFYVDNANHTNFNGIQATNVTFFNKGDVYVDYLNNVGGIKPLGQFALHSVGLPNANIARTHNDMMAYYINNNHLHLYDDLATMTQIAMHMERYCSLILCGVDSSLSFPTNTPEEIVMYYPNDYITVSNDIQSLIGSSIHNAQNSKVPLDQKLLVYAMTGNYYFLNLLMSRIADFVVAHNTELGSIPETTCLILRRSRSLLPWDINETVKMFTDLNPCDKHVVNVFASTLDALSNIFPVVISDALRTLDLYKVRMRGIHNRDVLGTPNIASKFKDLDLINSFLSFSGFDQNDIRYLHRGGTQIDKDIYGTNSIATSEYHNRLAHGSSYSNSSRGIHNCYDPSGGVGATAGFENNDPVYDYYHVERLLDNNVEHHSMGMTLSSRLSPFKGGLCSLEGISFYGQMLGMINRHSIHAPLSATKADKTTESSDLKFEFRKVKESVCHGKPSIMQAISIGVNEEALVSTNKSGTTSAAYTNNSLCFWENKTYENGFLRDIKLHEFVSVDDVISIDLSGNLVVTEPESKAREGFSRIKLSVNIGKEISFLSDLLRLSSAIRRNKKGQYNIKSAFITIASNLMHLLQNAIGEIDVSELYPKPGQENSTDGLDNFTFLLEALEEVMNSRVPTNRYTYRAFLVRFQNLMIAMHVMGDILSDCGEYYSMIDDSFIGACRNQEAAHKKGDSLEGWCLLPSRTQCALRLNNEEFIVGELVIYRAKRKKTDTEWRYKASLVDASTGEVYKHICAIYSEFSRVKKVIGSMMTSGRLVPMRMPMYYNSDAYYTLRNFKKHNKGVLDAVKGDTSTLSYTKYYTSLVDLTHKYETIDNYSGKITYNGCKLDKRKCMQAYSYLSVSNATADRGFMKFLLDELSATAGCKIDSEILSKIVQGNVTEKDPRESKIIDSFVPQSVLENIATSGVFSYKLQLGNVDMLLLMACGGGYLPALDIGVIQSQVTLSNTNGGEFRQTMDYARLSKISTYSYKYSAQDQRYRYVNALQPEGLSNQCEQYTTYHRTSPKLQPMVTTPMAEDSRDNLEVNEASVSVPLWAKMLPLSRMMLVNVNMSSQSIPSLKFSVCPNVPYVNIGNFRMPLIAMDKLHLNKDSKVLSGHDVLDLFHDTISDQTITYVRAYDRSNTMPFTSMLMSDPENGKVIQKHLVSPVANDYNILPYMDFFSNKHIVFQIIGAMDKHEEFISMALDRHIGVYELGLLRTLSLPYFNQYKQYAEARAKAEMLKDSVMNNYRNLQPL